MDNYNLIVDLTGSVSVMCTDLIETRDGMVLAHEKIVMAHANYYKKYGVEVDDLIQEGFLGVMYAIDRWNPEMGKTLDQYVRQGVDWKMKNALRSKRKRVNTRPNEKLDREIQDGTFEEVENKDYILNLFRFISERQERVMRHLYIEGDCTNFQEAADRMDITREGVRQLYNKAMTTITQNVWGMK